MSAYRSGEREAHSYFTEVFALCLRKQELQPLPAGSGTGFTDHFLIEDNKITVI